VEARTAGHRVLVDSRTTASQLTYANPDGSFTLLVNVAPVRTLKNGSWVDLDATLTANPDASLSPKAVNGTLVFSAGGTMPLVRADDGAGHGLTLTFPTRLPAPTRSGASATYPDVYPGVDLVVTAAKDGGFSEVLVIKDAAAAADPALRDVHLGLSTHGMDLAQQADGGLTFTDPYSGESVFAAANPTVWDATTTARPGARSARAKARLEATVVTPVPGVAASTAMLRPRRNGADPAAFNFSRALSNSSRRCASSM